MGMLFLNVTFLKVTFKKIYICTKIMNITEEL